MHISHSLYALALAAASQAISVDEVVYPRALVEGDWGITQDGTTGVSAQQLAIVSETTAIIFDKVENNPLKVNGHAAWGSEFNLVTREARALNPISNTWCATGGFLGNGTFVNSGGNPMVGSGINGLQGLRLFDPCEDESCDVFENTRRVRLTSPRWYPSSVRIQDGSLMIWAGSVTGGFINAANVNNPTYEFYPAKNINGFNGLQIPSQFFRDTLNGNHFPNLVLLPDGTVFVSANQQAMIFNWETNTERRLPNIPNGVRISSPFSAGHALLPLTPENNYAPEIIICGGATVDDTVDPSRLSSQTPASDQCARILLTDEGIDAGWTVETMPEARIMAEIIHLPDQRLLIVNGAKTGVAGYGNVGDQVGQSNADNPTFTPVIYDPAAPEGSRFSSDGLPTSSIPRLYHSTASLTPNGSVLVAGSNPNNDVETRKYPTEYRVEFFDPPYMTQPRPEYEGLPSVVDYESEFKLQVSLPDGVESVDVVIIDLGFATHAVHMDARLVKLESKLSGSTLTVTGPPSGNIYPPGPAFLYVVTDAGVPSFGHKLIIGDGSGPPVDQAAIDNMLANTSNPRLPAASVPSPTSGEGSSVASEVIEA